MTTPDPWLNPDAWEQRRHRLSEVTMLLVVCLVLALGWANTWNQGRTLVEITKTEQAGAWQCVEIALVELDSLRAGITRENQRVFLLGSRKLLEDRP